MASYRDCNGFGPQDESRAGASCNLDVLWDNRPAESAPGESILVFRLWSVIGLLCGSRSTASVASFVEVAIARSLGDLWINRLSRLWTFVGWFGRRSPVVGLDVFDRR